MKTIITIDMKATLETSVKNWYKVNYTNDYFGSVGANIRKNLKFKTVLKRMAKGENFYNIVFKNNYSDSIGRERIFEGISEAFKIDYNEIYNIWLNQN